MQRIEMFSVQSFPMELLMLVSGVEEVASATVL
eukprot:CAMPEP_0178381932 /NCGR_PEP_ID=MMETSP0689_2-20121128/6238_1 /TAXON_ID=160604 /ORGANISM="Amphidinium massartii, Strain CS-259" /LENGTH=32 /DNA_ID= /DNA_START= /DNA_END= /DNA_ORIENTATION=